MGWVSKDTPTTNSTLGAPIPLPLPTLPDPDTLRFILTYDSTYGAKDIAFTPSEITYFRLSATIYTYQLFLYGIN
jgi:hypothetical protein